MPENMTNIRTTITGAGGFLGSHIARYLGSKGHEVCVVGRFASLSEASAIPNLWKLCGMTLPDRRFDEAVDEFKPTLLVHCAGTASVVESVNAPYTDFHRTVEVCAYVLETLRKFSPGCHFIFLSSAAVYGNPQMLPVRENTPLVPISPYGYHKMICELLVEEYSALHGIPSAIFRIFSAYGEGLERQVVHDLFSKFYDPHTDVVEIFGTGIETRDFIHADDIARLVEIIAEKQATGIFNVASGYETTIGDLAKMIAIITGSTKKLFFNGVRRQGDPEKWQADISRLTDIGFSPAVSMQEGLEAYARWYCSLHKSFK